jgi:hypothetical protein
MTAMFTPAARVGLGKGEKTGLSDVNWRGGLGRAAAGVLVEASEALGWCSQFAAYVFNIVSPEDSKPSV